MSEQEFDQTAGRSASGLDFEDLLGRLLQQNGYSSDNTKHGLRSSLKDYEALFHTDAPDWLKLVWPSIAVSLVHLALSFKKPLPKEAKIPESALKNGL